MLVPPHCKRSALQLQWRIRPAGCDWPIRLRSEPALSLSNGTSFELGLNWLCFSGPENSTSSCNPFLAQCLRQFVPGQIGFVFSNHDIRNTSDEIRRWPCFFKSRYTQYASRNTRLALFFSPRVGPVIHNPFIEQSLCQSVVLQIGFVFSDPSTAFRTSGLGPANWLCFAQKVVKTSHIYAPNAHKLAQVYDLLLIIAHNSRSDLDYPLLSSGS